MWWGTGRAWFRGCPVGASPLVGRAALEVIELSVHIDFCLGLVLAPERD